jgi:RNA polymerase sigma factor (sigma-70 family)
MLVARYKNLVYSVPVRYRMSPEDAADVFQQVWLALFSELPHLRHTGALRSWLLTVAAHKCSRWRRRQLPLGSPEDSAIERRPDEAGLEWQKAAEKEQTFRQALTQLPERCQQLVRMLFYEDPPLPYALVARKLGLAEGSIGFIRGRCLQKLKTQLERMGF